MQSYFAKTRGSLRNRLIIFVDSLTFLVGGAVGELVVVCAKMIQRFFSPIQVSGKSLNRLTFHKGRGY